MDVAIDARVATADKDRIPETQPRPWRKHLAAMPDAADAGALVGRAFRTVSDGASTLQALTACGCGLRPLQEPWIDTTTAQRPQRPLPTSGRRDKDWRRGGAARRQRPHPAADALAPIFVRIFLNPHLPGRAPA